MPIDSSSNLGDIVPTTLADFVIRNVAFSLKPIEEALTDSGLWIGKNLLQTGFNANEARWRALL
jgi:hypothetical protein